MFWLALFHCVTLLDYDFKKQFNKPFPFSLETIPDQNGMQGNFTQSPDPTLRGSVKSEGSVVYSSRIRPPTPSINPLRV